MIDTQSVDTGYTTFDEHIQGEDFLDTAKYPTATFKSTKVVFEGDKPVAVEGNLTLKGCGGCSSANPVIGPTSVVGRECNGQLPFSLDSH